MVSKDVRSNFAPRGFVVCNCRHGKPGFPHLHTPHGERRNGVDLPCLPIRPGKTRRDRRA